MKAFEGIRVVDFTHVLAGPFSTYQLAVMGADVIKIEGPHRPDMMRPMGDSEELSSSGRGTEFVCQNGNKRSLAVDLNTSDGVEIVRKLVSGADVLVENFRGGVLERKGLGYEQLKALNPELIYCSITGFGRTGPKAEHPAYDNVIQAFSGMMAATGSPSNHPVRVGPPVLDYGTGAQAAFAIASALFQRSRTGEGQHIDVAMSDAALMLMTTNVMETQTKGSTPVPYGNENPLRATYSLYRASDTWLMIGAFTNAQASRLFSAIGELDLAQQVLEFSTPEFARDVDAHREKIAAAIATRSADDWEQDLNSRGVPAARVRRIDEAMAHDQIKSRQVLQPSDALPETGQQLLSRWPPSVLNTMGPASRCQPPYLVNTPLRYWKSSAMVQTKSTSWNKPAASVALD